MKLGELSKFYYTAAEARKVLGIDEDTLQYWGRKERIKKVKLPGRSQAVYSRKEIDDLASQIEATVLIEQPKSIVFRKATINDIDQEAQLAHIVFGEKAAAREERKAFLEKNPDSDYHLYDYDSLAGYINVTPMDHQTIEDFVNGMIPNIWKVDIEAVKPFELGKPLECLIIDMVTTPTVPPGRRSYYGSRILMGLVEVLNNMGLQGINITKVYAASRTSTGIRILKNAGFQVIREGERGRLSFMLDLENTDEKLLRQYQESLKLWKDDKVVHNSSNEIVEKPSNKAKSRTRSKK